MSEKNKTPIKFRHIYFQVFVEDLDRAKQFYEDIFDFKVSYYQGAALGWCEFHLPGTNARLGLNASPPEGRTNVRSGVLTIDVENLEETKSYLESKGLETSEIYDNPGNVSFFNIQDTEGNKVQIVSEPRIEA